MKTPSRIIPSFIVAISQIIDVHKSNGVEVPVIGIDSIALKLHLTVSETIALLEILATQGLIQIYYPAPSEGRKINFPGSFRIIDEKAFEIPTKR